uniref:Golgi associated RAB2 interactor protein-like Rab2B-binding domain-containing protein n=1 Tax=Erpetoichthys calabaricus TaxID=27687 RepID=A0A8C4SI83_ERPCA
AEGGRRNPGRDRPPGRPVQRGRSEDPARLLRERHPREQLRGAGVPHLTTLTMKKKKIGHLTRRLPLSEVRLAVHSEERQQLKVELRTGHTHHLRLLAAAGNEKAVFEQWVRLVSRLGEGGTAQEPEDDESVCTEEPEDKPVSEVEGLTSDHRLGLHGLVYPHLGVVQSARWDIGMMKS